MVIILKYLHENYMFALKKHVKNVLQIKFLIANWCRFFRLNFDKDDLPVAKYVDSVYIIINAGIFFLKSEKFVRKQWYSYSKENFVLL